MTSLQATIGVVDVLVFVHTLRTIILSKNIRLNFDDFLRTKKCAIFER